MKTNLKQWKHPEKKKLEPIFNKKCKLNWRISLINEHEIWLKSVIANGEEESEGWSMFKQWDGC